MARRIRAAAAVAACRATHAAMRALGRTARAMPGKVALRVDPHVIADLSSGQGRHAIVITGTNGKTTTTHIVQQGVLNRDGAAAYDPSSTNMVQGIATTLCLDSTLAGRRRSEWAVIECDEGASKSVLPAMLPDVLVVTNLYRDQVDRYVSWTTARDYIVEAAKASPGTLLVLDADCQVASSIAELVDNPVRWFGVDCDVYGDGIADHDDDVACVGEGCGRQLSFAHRTFAHLGDWSCDGCGRRRHEPDVSCVAMEPAGDTGCELRLRIDGHEVDAHANIRAGYDVYNAVAAVAGMLAMGLAEGEALAALARFRHAAHRFEVFDVDGTQVRLLLMKNTAGANQLINMLLSEDEPPTELVCMLGAEIMDGLGEVGWIGDVRWEALCGESTRVTVGGPRWADMRARLLAAGVPEANVRVEEDYGRLVDMLSASSEPHITVIANCSTIEALRATLVKRGHEPLDWWGGGAGADLA